MHQSCDIDECGRTGALARLEAKIDKMADALGKLITLEERQVNMAEDFKELRGDVKALEAKIEATNDKVDRWVNRAYGAWAFFFLLVTVLEVYTKAK